MSNPQQQQQGGKTACDHWKCPADICQEQDNAGPTPTPVIVHRLTGKWKEVDSANLDEFMKALDVNYLKRKVGEHTKFSEEWSINGAEITFKVSNPFKSSTSTFRLGELFQDKSMDGKDVKVIYTDDNGKLVARQHREDKNVVYTREVNVEETMILTMTVENPGSVPVNATIRFNREK